jgi:hypothetical protein
MLRIGFRHCPHCRRHDVRSSRPKSLWEDLIFMVLLRPVRCHDCMRRFYLPVFISTADVPVVSYRRVTPRPVQSPEQSPMLSPEPRREQNSAPLPAKRPAASEPAERRSA